MTRTDMKHDIDNAYEETNLEKICDCMIGALNSSAAEIIKEVYVDN